MVNYIDNSALERLRSLLLVARFPVSGIFSGIHRSLHKGSAMEFAELRNYTPGDDLRRLDWKAYGRSDRFYLKEYESETNVRAYFLLDQSGSMNFTGEGGETRLDYAKEIVATLAALFLYQGDAVGVVYTEGKQIVAPLHRGESSLGHVLRGLEQVSATGQIDLCEQLNQLATVIPRRSLVIVVSDFLTPLDPLSKALNHLRHCSHETTCLQLLSERETEFRVGSITDFVDLESGNVIKSDPSAIKKEYLDRLQAHQTELQALCTRNQVDWMCMPQEKDSEHALRDFLTSRIDQS